MRIDYLPLNKPQAGTSGDKASALDSSLSSIVPNEVQNPKETVTNGYLAKNVLPTSPEDALLRKGIELTESNRALAESAFSDFPKLEEVLIEEEMQPTEEEKIVEKLEIPRDAVERLKRSMENSDLKTALTTLLGTDGTTADLLETYVSENRVSNDLALHTLQNSERANPLMEFVKQSVDLDVLQEMAVYENLSYDGALVNSVEMLESVGTSDGGQERDEKMESFHSSDHPLNHSSKTTETIRKVDIGFDSVQSRSMDTSREMHSQTENPEGLTQREERFVAKERRSLIQSQEQMLQESERAPKPNEIESADRPDVAEMNYEQVYQLLQQVLEGLESTVDGLNVKQYVVERMTERTIHAAQEFQKFQKTIMHALEKTTPDRIHRAIDELTKAINKSEFSLFTDMMTEKKLLVSLSDLEKARLALQSKEFETANQIVKRVRATIEAITFQPTSRKIQAFAVQMAHRTEDVLKGKKVTLREKMMEGLQLYASSPTGRDALQLARFMGANHEIEQLEQTVGISDIKNVRELLLKFSDEGDPLLMQSTGQQMMNDSDGRERDFYMFTLPYEEDGQIEGMKVFLNGKSKDNRLDWQNADLYFSLKKHGERVGVKIRVMSGIVHFETSGFSPAFRGIQSELEEMGYRLGSVKRIDLPPEDRTLLGISGSERPMEDVTPTKERRGLDVKI